MAKPRKRATRARSKTSRSISTKTRARSKSRSRRSSTSASSRTGANAPIATTAVTATSGLHRGIAAALAAFALIFIAGLLGDAMQLRSVHPPLSPAAIRNTPTYQQIKALAQEVNSLEQRQAQAEIQVVPSSQLDQQLVAIEIATVSGRQPAAQTLTSQLQQTITSNSLRLSQLQAAATAAAVAQTPNQPPADAPVTVPILIYHDPPPDFSAQLDQLQAEGYTTITPDELADALHGGEPLPAKPALITFDDGYENQMSAFHDLVQHQMRATFYIISGGQRSHWCIGVNRRQHDPSQPPGGCGDSYLSWSQIKQLDASGLITIGAHTVDHDNLPTDSPAMQKFEITRNKHELEAHLKHPVDSFAYPYGAYDATTLAIVQAAGFHTAVTTNPGLTQTLAGIYTLYRVRSVAQLPQ